MAQPRYTFTVGWILIATTAAVFHLFGGLKFAIVLFCLTPFALVADIVRRRFSSILGQKSPAGVQGRNNSPPSS